ncbi:MAG TPA: hypothetical protein VNZ05_01980 [Solirubrobacteraceae bacterium]|nr:hypothetical protein [Solirubrobacteraceae bacterium]
MRVPAHPDVRGAVAISFRPSGRLPRGGYYYAVAVLARYPGYSRAAPPPCAVSSDMRRTAYAYPRGGQYVRLTLRAASSARRRWCSGGTYDGAVYAVPHKPPCSAEYPCGRSTALSPCWEVEGRRVCGVVANPEPHPREEPPRKGEMPRYSYPGGLPAPIDRSARIIVRFELRF